MTMHLRIIATLALLVVAPASALAQQSGNVPTVHDKCFAVSRGASEVSTILLNQCTGETWVLTRNTTDVGKGSWIWMWNPVSVARDTIENR